VGYYTSVFEGLCYLLLLQVIREGRLRVLGGAFASSAFASGALD
jgi:hypothetical protein